MTMISSRKSNAGNNIRFSSARPQTLKSQNSSKETEKKKIIIMRCKQKHVKQLFSGTKPRVDDDDDMFLF